MHPIRMVATDLDGTLLPKSKKISAYSIEVFQELHQRGVKLVIATGRPIRAMREFLPQIPFDAHICHNGAISFVGERQLNRQAIAREVLVPFAEQLLRRHPQVQLIIECDDVMYVNFDVATLWNENTFTLCSADSLTMPYADKMMVIFNEAVGIEDVTKLLPPQLYMDLSYDHAVGLIMSCQARKHLALSEVAAHFGLGLSEVACFGDDVNDLGMIRDCGYGIAMANGIDSVKEVAFDIAINNEEDGVARWLAAHFQI